MDGAGSRGRVERPLTKLVHESVRELATIARLDAIGIRFLSRRAAWARLLVLWLKWTS